MFFNFLLTQKKFFSHIINKYNFVLALILICSPKVFSNASSSDIPIRVLIKKINSTHKYIFNQTVNVSRNGSAFAIVEKSNSAELSPGSEKITLTIQGKEFSGESFDFQSEESFTEFEKKKYRGIIRFVCSGKSLMILNVLNLEDYLRGVLPSELGNIKSDSLKEAIEAFCITSRTFALNRIKEKKKYYDLESSVLSQVFSSVETENKLCNYAIDNTKSLIVSYEGKPAQVFYSSCCGGYIEDSRNVFNATLIPYLKAHPDGEPANCRFSPFFKWQEEYSAEDIVNLLKSSGKKIGDSLEITNMNITDIYESGRAYSLDIHFSDSSVINILSKDMRNIIKRKNGKGILKSSLFKVTEKFQGEKLDLIILEGKGNGHGVGLCQWGSFQLSKEGKSYSEILQFYFPQTKIININETN